LSVIIETGRFGQLTVGNDESITIPQGILGFPELTKFCLVDPGDETLILWLQSQQDSKIAFPVLEPKVFRPDYAARLSSAELRELKLENVNQSAVFAILTIPEDATLMTANLKAPIVINLKEQQAKQVVLQENEYSIKHLMFKELRQHLITIRSQQRAATTEAEAQVSPVSIRNIPPSLTVRSLQA
jgi:flagellar assembly factor FliW